MADNPPVPQIQSTFFNSAVIEEYHDFYGELYGLFKSFFK